ncbi:cytochrome-c peroxidase [Aestuariibacter salexigens]|uniref:cytochrome-c peroxidase n=1 Tax=Aestuariibacter salexigens TaxID=226010 RepID=UPI0003FB9F72|nr:cytochrome c peroxidase [Aestuariibacter salexigens]
MFTIKSSLIFLFSFVIVSIAQASTIPASIEDSDFSAHSAEKVELGKNLFWDKILSGNENIACASCHHSLAGTGDGLALPIGEGGQGVGITRRNGEGNAMIAERVPRNAPPIYNLGALSFDIMFHDGRLFEDPSQPGGFRTPAGAQFPEGVESALAAQAFFPVQSGTEMAGAATDNPQGAAAAAGILAGEGGVWDIIADKLRAIPEYVGLFQAAYPDQIYDSEDIQYVHIANAIAAFEASAFRADNSPFDNYLRGDESALTSSAKRGMQLFYGKANCSSCHTGPLLTDLEFHAIAMPQIGPGKNASHDDFGRELVSGNIADRYKFRTPTLRNVALTGPWGHAGAYDSLRAVVEHHLDPIAGLYTYADDVANNQAQAVLPEVGDAGDHDFTVMLDASRVADIAAANELPPVVLKERQIDDLMAFLYALTSTSSLDERHTVPRSVPSGLPVAD